MQMEMAAADQLAMWALVESWDFRRLDFAENSRRYRRCWASGEALRALNLSAADGNDASDTPAGNVMDVADRVFVDSVETVRRLQ